VWSERREKGGMEKGIERNRWSLFPVCKSYPLGVLLAYQMMWMPIKLLVHQGQFIPTFEPSVRRRKGGGRSEKRKGRKE
jgi:hypothetical protein